MREMSFKVASGRLRGERGELKGGHTQPSPPEQRISWRALVGEADGKSLNESLALSIGLDPPLPVIEEKPLCYNIHTTTVKGIVARDASIS